MTMYVDKSNLNVVSLHFLMKKKGIPTVYNVENNPILLARLDTVEVFDDAGGDVFTGKCELREDGKYYKAYRAYTSEEIVEQEQVWAATELKNSDIELAKHNDGHSRAVGTKAQWVAYRNALRNHVTAGVVTTVRADVEATKPQ